MDMMLDEKNRRIQALERRMEIATDPGEILDLDDQLDLLREDVAQVWHTRTPSGQMIQVVQCAGGEVVPMKKISMSCPGNAAAGEKALTALRRANLLAGHLKKERNQAVAP